VAFRTLFPETGEDVKVMGVRSGRTLELTVAMPQLDRCLTDERDYFDRKERIHDAIVSRIRSRLATLDDVALGLNATDRRGAGLAGVYASVLGISAESAHSGEVGRGNRANGLISFSRPGGAEAIAGKNPIGHVGRIYGMLAFALADTLVRRLAPGAVLRDIERAARTVVDEELA
jgi:S-adenosylmethionine synthetase